MKTDNKMFNTRPLHFRELKTHAMLEAALKSFYVHAYRGEEDNFYRVRIQQGKDCVWQESDERIPDTSLASHRQRVETLQRLFEITDFEKKVMSFCRKYLNAQDVTIYFNLDINLDIIRITDIAQSGSYVSQDALESIVEGFNEFSPKAVRLQVDNPREIFYPWVNNVFSRGTLRKCIKLLNEEQYDAFHCDDENTPDRNGICCDVFAVFQTYVLNRVDDLKERYPGQSLVLENVDDANERYLVQ